MIAGGGLVFNICLIEVEFELFYDFSNDSHSWIFMMLYNNNTNGRTLNKCTSHMGSTLCYFFIYRSR